MMGVLLSLLFNDRGANTVQCLISMQDLVKKMCEGGGMDDCLSWDHHGGGKEMWLDLNLVWEMILEGGRCRSILKT